MFDDDQDLVDLSAEPSLWLLHVEPPGEDGWSYRPPEVRLEGAELPTILRYRSSWVGEHNGVTPSGRILDEFIRLAEIGPAMFPERVAAFASRYGELSICAHGKPSGHANCRPLFDESKIPDGPMQNLQVISAMVTDFLYYEPLEAWRRYSRQLKAMLRVVHCLQSDPHTTDDEDWEAIAAGDPPGATVTAPRIPRSGEPPQAKSPYAADFSRSRPTKSAAAEEKLASDWSDILDAIQVWLTFGAIGVCLDWLGGPFAQAHLNVKGLAGTLAVALAAAAQGPVYVCYGCSTPFALPVGRNRPAENKRKWCDTCGRHGQKRLAARNWYARKKAIRSTPDSQPDSQA